MEALEAIFSRRSIRRYAADKIPPEIIGGLLKAAMAAPSASNKQPWHFIVITTKEVLEAVPLFHPYAGMLTEASAAIAVCGNIEVQPDFWIQDCAAATQNILLAAHAGGLGAVWLAIYPREARIEGLRKLLDLPANILPLSLVALGYPDEKKSPSNRYNPSKIHFNRW